jgi:hypothetical protein
MMTPVHFYLEGLGHLRLSPSNDMFLELSMALKSTRVRRKTIVAGHSILYHQHVWEI